MVGATTREAGDPGETSSVVAAWIRISPGSGDAPVPAVRFSRPMTGGSDLIGVPVTLGAILAFLGVLAAFFFVGPILGIVLLIALVVLAIVLVVRVIRANELS
jgi:hypothetical protein